MWTLILALTLVAGGTMVVPDHVRADYAPGETTPPPSPDTGEGDPDWPDGKTSSPKPGPTRGVASPGYRTIAPERMGLSGKWLWSFRVAVSTIYRTYFRF